MFIPRVIGRPISKVGAHPVGGASVGRRLEVNRNPTELGKAPTSGKVVPRKTTRGSCFGKVHRSCSLKVGTVKTFRPGRSVASRFRGGSLSIKARFLRSKR
ncbi:penicillin-binding protein 1A [Anopheles sinensis]|uniref:Penicillin-binding protein 1A n=1 Tax=Anopheles sinensis TaxID=74873 RepID=A0A084VEA4_ANOSI|nr:penicillin-binding protein 1A [Anopheles sinensis]